MKTGYRVIPADIVASFPAAISHHEAAALAMARAAETGRQHAVIYVVCARGPEQDRTP